VLEVAPRVRLHQSESWAVRGVHENQVSFAWNRKIRNNLREWRIEHLLINMPRSAVLAMDDCIEAMERAVAEESKGWR